MSHSATIQKISDAFNRHDAGAFASFYAENAVVYDPQYPEPLRGREAIEKDIADFHRAFPDITSEMRTILEKGDSTAGEWKLNGTNSGPFATPEGDTPATGKKMTIGVGTFSRFDKEGKIVEEHRYFNVASIFDQLGLTQEAAA